MDIGHTNSYSSSELAAIPPFFFCLIQHPAPALPHSSLEGKGAAIELLGGPEPSLLGRRAAQQEELV